MLAEHGHCPGRDLEPPVGGLSGQQFHATGLDHGRRVRVVEHEEPAAAAIAVPAHDLHAGGRAGNDGSGTGPRRRAREQPVAGALIQLGRHVPGCARPEGVPGDSRLPSERARRIARQHVRPLGAQILAPQGAVAAAGYRVGLASQCCRPIGQWCHPICQGHGLAAGERAELLDPDPEYVAQRARATTKTRVMLGVHHATAEGHHDVPPGRDVLTQRPGALVGDQVCARGEDQPVPGQITVGMDEVTDHPSPPQRGMISPHQVQVTHLGQRNPAVLQGPPGVGIPQQRNLGGHCGADDLAEARDCTAELADLAEDPGVRAGVRHHRGVEHLRARGGRPPLEEHDAVRSAGQVPDAVTQHAAGLLGEDAVALVDEAG